MKREEVLNIVRGFFNNPKPEEEEDMLVRKLKHALPNSGITDLMFYDDRGLTPEEIVDEAFRREAEHTLQKRSQ